MTANELKHSMLKNTLSKAKQFSKLKTVILSKNKSWCKIFLQSAENSEPARGVNVCRKTMPLQTIS